MPKVCLSAFLLTVIVASGVRGQTVPESSQPGPRLEPLRPGMTEARLFAAMLEQNERRMAALSEYVALRTYAVRDPGGKLHAEEVGRMQFRAPGQKTFVVTSEKGSALVRRLALSRLIDSEIRAASGKEHHDSAISPANYRLELLGEQQVGPYRCFVAQAIPKRADKYLFEGKVWISVEDFAVVRIEGHPAANLSFWVKSADFIRQYQKIDGFWLPQKDETLVHVRLYGTKVLTIEHADYKINRRG
ncbi:MAG TPA: hypothetical protein VMB03_22710 [Bryobacteraceae bacterium]|nr:hypothetical protein [Bryobacteraceae bacterium]